MSNYDSIINKPEKFNDKYRIASARLQDYDYSSLNAYFITICTKDRECFFGEIINEKLQETTQAKICQNVWNELPNYFSNCFLDSFIIMPDHVHGIIVLTESDLTNKNKINRDATKFERGGITKNKNPMLYKNLSTIIRLFKGLVTINIRKNNFKFCWQTRFYDRIVRNDCELNSIREYIINNPVNWKNDNNKDDDFIW